jgi:hypothetical protein
LLKFLNGLVLSKSSSGQMEEVLFAQDAKLQCSFTSRTMKNALFRSQNAFLIIGVVSSYS